jgi:uncharacterized protein
MPDPLALLERFLSETVRLFMEISPYLLVGFFFAGLLHTLLGEKYIKKHFAISGLWSTIKAAIFGVPLPVCSCGVIPLAESLRKDGASKSATMSFLVSTPSSGVDSILATYALMGPVYAVFRPIASFLSGILVGVVTHFAGSEKDNKRHSPITPNKKESKKSVKEVFEYGFKVIPSEIAKWLLIGVIIGGAISAVVPANFGEKYLLGNPVLNYVVILLISLPLYVCATGSIPIAASLIAKGVLPGAALAFLIAGPATNTVTISFVYKKMGRKVAALYVISIIIVSVVTGLIFDAVMLGGETEMGPIALGGAHLPHYIELLCALVMALVFLNAKYDFSRTITMFIRRNENMEGRTIHTIKVPDMTCRHCQMKISNALQEIPEIKSVSIDLGKQEVSVESSLLRETIVERIKQEGYKPE